MRIVCLDLEGVLVPEIWVALAHRTQIKDLLLTTRDIEDYDELMSLRLKVLENEGLTIKDIHNSVKTLDPFAGAGTTGLVAKENNRAAILIELNGEYLAMAKKRIETVLI